jgi:hypothetical protein
VRDESNPYHKGSNHESEEVKEKAGDGIRTQDRARIESVNVQLGNDPGPDHNAVELMAQEPPGKEDTG